MILVLFFLKKNMISYQLTNNPKLLLEKKENVKENETTANREVTVSCWSTNYCVSVSIFKNLF